MVVVFLEREMNEIKRRVKCQSVWCTLLHEGEREAFFCCICFVESRSDSSENIIEASTEKLASFFFFNDSSNLLNR